jgi:hypothetical protein
VTYVRIFLNKQFSNIDLFKSVSYSPRCIQIISIFPGSRSVPSPYDMREYTSSSGERNELTEDKRHRRTRKILRRILEDDSGSVDEQTRFEP